MLMPYRECGAPLENCFGFIDGTVRPICRPGQNQRVVYNGHKRVHALKFQSVALPNCIIGNIQLFQKMLSGRTTNVNCRTAIARLKRNVGIEY